MSIDPSESDTKSFNSNNSNIIDNSVKQENSQNTNSNTDEK